MKQKTYSEKLKDPRWQKKRLEILERDEWECKACGDKDTTLHVHHIFYIPGKEPWEIPNGLLVTFCERCHKNLPCDTEGYSSCDECPAYKDDCNGPGNHSEDIINLIGLVLNDIWSQHNNVCRGDYNTLLMNAHYVLKG